MDECWKPCSINTSYYVSNYGRFKNLSGNINIRKPHSTGYIRVYISGIGHKPLHVLVATEFIPNSSSDKTMVNHIDGVKTNNNILNLEWVTPKENCLKRVNKTHRIEKNNYRFSNVNAEEWKELNYNGFSVKASTLGRIELPSGYKTRGSLSSDGYLNINLRNSTAAIQKMFRVHRIICTAFHGEPITEDLVVNHKDYNKTNNNPENLEWVTNKENNNHGKLNKQKCIGHNRKKVHQYSIDKKELIATYDNITIASQLTGANRSAIVQMCNKWRGKIFNSVGGYYWEYSE